jgi:hypothetical protein
MDPVDRGAYRGNTYPKTQAIQYFGPDTGTRYLEELAFEVVSTQSKRDVTIRAEDLTARGVRRLLAIFVKQAEIREWSPSKNDWVTLPLDGKLEDPTLARPVEIKALLDAAAADDAVVDARCRRARAALAARGGNGAAVSPAHPSERERACQS